jgi:hypothetical protein
MVTRPKGERVLTRIAYDRPEAAAALGMGITSFETYVAPHIRSVRAGRLVLYPVRELEKWVEQNARLTLERAHDPV